MRGLDHAIRAASRRWSLSTTVPSREDYDRALVGELIKRGVTWSASRLHALLSRNFVDAFPRSHPEYSPVAVAEITPFTSAQQALNDGATESGATVHFVNNDLDAGPIVLQRAVPVLPEDTAQTLADRILAVEHTLYPDAIAKVLGLPVKQPGV